MEDIPQKNNFDLLRLFLAFSVCFAHLSEITGITEFIPLAKYFNSGLAVDCFFVLSGFLIFRSFYRSSNSLSYLNKRVRRIYPAYLTVVVLAAILLPFLLVEKPGEILFGGDWLRYLFANLGFLNFLQPDIPGIFTDNPFQAVNSPLWTIKVEVMFYLSVPLIFMLFRFKKRWIVLCALYIASLIWSASFLYLHFNTPLEIYLKLEKQLPGQLTFFLTGGGLYLYFPFFKKYWKQALSVACIIFLLQESLFFKGFYPLALGIAVISFALMLPSLGNWGRFGDMSYGVYIYHFPVIQIFTAYSLFGSHPWPTFTGLIITILTISFLSYRYIERPFLQRGSHYRRATEDTETA